MNKVSGRQAGRVLAGSASPRRQLRAPVKWALIGTLLATVVSLFLPQRGLVSAWESDAAVPASSSLGSRAVRGSPAAVARTQPPLASASRAGEPPLVTSGATFDPFIGVVIPPPSVPPPAAQPVVTPMPPAPPAQEYRFLGRITSPDGSEQFLLSRGDASAAVTTGTVLDNGYVVESISQDAVVLVYPPLGSKVSIPIGTNPSGP